MTYKFRSYDVQDVAKYILALSRPDEGDLISNLKLQKLCYYAQGIVAAVRPAGAAPLFQEPIEAWKHGPVVRELYDAYKQYGDQAIPATDLDLDFDQFDENDKDIISLAFDHYGQFSAWKLRQMTHEETPWRRVYDENKRGVVISLESIKQFFDGELEDGFRDGFYEEKTT